MGDEQQYDETQTGDAKIRDLGCEYRLFNFLAWLLISFLNDWSFVIHDGRYAMVMFKGYWKVNKGRSWQTKVNSGYENNYFLSYFSSYHVQTSQGCWEKERWVCRLSELSNFN